MGHELEEFSPAVGSPRQDDVARQRITSDVNLIFCETEGRRQADGLTTAIPEQLGNVGRTKLLVVSTMIDTTGSWRRLSPAHDSPTVLLSHGLDENLRLAGEPMPSGQQVGKFIPVHAATDDDSHGAGNASEFAAAGLGYNGNGQLLTAFCGDSGMVQQKAALASVQ